MALQLLYFYDALCGWCYGFSPQIKMLAAQYKTDVDITVVSGGMVIGPQAGPMPKAKADYILQAIPQVEQTTGIRFGEPFLTLLKQEPLPYQSSLKPAIGLAVVKKEKPACALDFASHLQNSQYGKGLNLEEDAAYEKAFASIDINVQHGLEMMGTLGARAAATQDFQLAQSLGITGFPALVAHANDQYYLLCHGFQRASVLAGVVDKLLGRS